MLIGVVFGMWLVWPTKEEFALRWYASCMSANFTWMPEDEAQKEFCFQSTARGYKESVDIEKLLKPLL